MMFSEHGFEVLVNVMSPTECDAVDEALRHRPMAGAGTRNLLGATWCKDLADKVRRCPEVARLLPASHVAVQCTYFEKSALPGRNWLVPLHQDLSIPVAEKIDHASLSGWSEKEGTLYVQPPLDVLEDMVAVRLHLDVCHLEDGPLKVVPGSHTLGILGPEAGLQAREAAQDVACLAARGGAVVMRPLILHASSKASGQSLRRVLHFVFGPRTLPFGLRWQTTV